MTLFLVCLILEEAIVRGDRKFGFWTRVWRAIVDDDPWY